MCGCEKASSPKFLSRRILVLEQTRVSQSSALRQRLHEPPGGEAGRLRPGPRATGTVIAQQITGSGPADFFTVMGSDMRTILGGGNLSLVAGGLRRIGGANGTPPKSMYASYDKVFLTLAPFVPSMSPAGAVHGRDTQPVRGHEVFRTSP